MEGCTNPTTWAELLFFVSVVVGWIWNCVVNGVCFF